MQKIIYFKKDNYNLQVLDPTTKQQTKQKVTFSDVYEEFNSTFSKDFKFKKVTKNFAFSIPNVHVPQSSEYLMVHSLFRVFNVITNI